MRTLQALRSRGTKGLGAPLATGSSGAEHRNPSWPSVWAALGVQAALTFLNSDTEIAQMGPTVTFVYRWGSQLPLLIN